MIELLLPGWLAGIMLACAAGPLARLWCGAECPILAIRWHTRLCWALPLACYWT